MTEREILWHATNDHPRDLMELIEGDLDGGRIDRKWRLFLCACARSAINASSTLGVESFLTIAERFADGEVGQDLLLHTREKLQRRLPSHGHPIELPEHAISAAIGTTYLRRDICLFDAKCHNLDNAAYASGNDDQEYATQAVILKDIFGNPFRPVAFSPEWRTDTVVSLARGMYESRDFGAMPILADALQDVGCENEEILNHCRDAAGTHVRGCWVVDLVLGKE